MSNVVFSKYKLKLIARYFYIWNLRIKKSLCKRSNIGNLDRMLNYQIVIDSIVNFQGLKKFLFRQ